MSVATLLLNPWRCSHRSMRWLMGVILALCLVGAVLSGAFHAQRDWPMTSAAILCLGVVFLWAFQFSACFLLALDGHTLRIPALQRSVVHSLLLYAVLSIVPPALVLGALGGHFIPIAALLALCCTASLAFALLPRYISLWFCLLPGIASGLHAQLPVPGPESVRFVDWAVPSVLVLLVVIVVRWRQLLRSPSPRHAGLSGAVVMQYRRTGTWGAWGSTQQSMTRLLRSLPDWMQGGADLRHVGPDSPIRALRVALGSWYVPQTLAGHLRSKTAVFVPLVFLVPGVIALSHFGAAHSSARDFWQGFLVGMVGSIGIFVPFMFYSLGARLLRRYWVQVNTELPLLALMPGLGSPARIRRALLRASLGLPLLGLGLLTVLVMSAGLALHIQGPSLVCITFSPLGTAFAFVAMALDVLGGQPMRMWRMQTLTFMLLALNVASMFVPLLTLGRHPLPHTSVVCAVVMLGWFGFVVGMTFIGRRGWHTFNGRPHPFLTPQETAR